MHQHFGAFKSLGVVKFLCPIKSHFINKEHLEVTVFHDGVVVFHGQMSSKLVSFVTTQTVINGEGRKKIYTKYGHCPTIEGHIPLARQWD